jgi:peptidoglycan/xylan/chitin deacetylase (PgdA/CDA1 family)
MKKFMLMMATIGLCAGCAPKADKVIALSFDDGPNTTTTVKMLDMLEKHDVVGSFFVIGNNINDESAEIMKRAYKMGCDIESHSRTHTAMASLSGEQIQEEIKYTSDLIEKYIGKRPEFFRPPYISVAPHMYDNIDLTFICGQGCNDWEAATTVEQRAEMVINNAADGQIVLLHDFVGNEATVEALDIIIPELKKQGYRFVTVPELFKLKKITPDHSKMYTNVLE